VISAKFLFWPDSLRDGNFSLDHALSSSNSYVSTASTKDTHKMVPNPCK